MPDEVKTTDEAVTVVPGEGPKKEEVPKTESTPQIDPALKKELQDAKGSIWKKVLIWGAGILAIIGAVIGIVFLLKGKGPVKGVKEAVQKAKTESAKADMEEKIKVAEAQGAEKKVIEKLEEIKEMDDEVKRLEELNKLL
jgi:hypothetical protein